MYEVCACNNADVKRIDRKSPQDLIRVRIFRSRSVMIVSFISAMESIDFFWIFCVEYLLDVKMYFLASLQFKAAHAEMLGDR